MSYTHPGESPWYDELNHKYSHHSNTPLRDGDNSMIGGTNEEFWRTINSFLSPQITENDTSQKPGVLEIELPRIKKEDINLELKEGILHLTIKGNLRLSRQIKLHASVNELKITSKLELGVLYIMLPAYPEEKPVKININ